MVEKFERAEELSKKKEKIELKKKIEQAPRKKEADGIRKKKEFEDKYKVKLKEFVEKDFWLSMLWKNKETNFSKVRNNNFSCLNSNKNVFWQQIY